MAAAEAKEAAVQASIDARKAEEAAKERTKHAALEERLAHLKSVVLQKESAIAARGFSVTESIDKQRFSYGLLLSGGRKRIEVDLKAPDAYRLHVYWHGVRDDDGWQVVIKSEDAATTDEVMAILGEWLITYGQTEIK
ncbi:MAG: hypothetical protein B7Z01_05820 [Brevundimonas subvibrioides]|nr:MAG: hypothetical protein B7Z01_05820 [Brevundimonas subvibrioides]